MFVSNNSAAPLAVLLTQENDRLQVAQKRHAAMSALLNALPESTPVPISVHDFGYCAQASINFEGTGIARRLLELYPPLPLVDLIDGSRTQKPRKYLRDNEHEARVTHIHPVVLKQEGRPSAAAVRWWTQVGETDVQIQLKDKNITLEDLGIDPERFTMHEHTYSTGSCTFYVRKLAKADGRPDAIGLWEQAWKEFSDRMNFRASQRQFIHALSALVTRVDRPLTQADLPEPQYLRGGQALVIPEGADMLATLNAMQATQRDRKAHLWDRIGDFRAAFSELEIEELLAFANRQQEALDDARVQAQTEFEQVRSWLATFFGSHGAVSSDIDVAPYVEQLCRKATGLAAVLSVSARGPKEVQVSVRLNDSRDATQQVSLAIGQALPPLRAQELPVEYA